ncbi:MAG: hypothetical protein V1784_11600, partial [bacterium]
AHFKIGEKIEHLLIKIAPDLEHYESIERHHPAVETLAMEESKSLKFELAKPMWKCWCFVKYVVKGTVKKLEDGQQNPICVGEVDIYDVDIWYCIVALADSIIEQIRDGLIDIVKDPPPEIEVPPHGPWPPDGDDDWCGTKPPKPFPPRHVNIMKELNALPPEWAFAKQRYEALPTAKVRMNAALDEMTVIEKRAYLDSEVVEGVKISQLLYCNTAQFRNLLIEKFQAFRFFLCWYPWLYWLWWPYCGYSLEKLGTATLKPDGSFSKIVWLSVCRHDTPDLWFVVRQKIGGAERVIYARHPVPCNTHWNHPSGQPVHLLVYDPLAVSCHQTPPVDIAEPYVMPMGIYEDEWWQIHQAHIPSPVNPATPLPSQCGLFNQTDPYGTRLDLRMELHHDLRNLLPPNNGVRFYRWSYRRHGTTDWIHINTPISHRYITQVGGDWFIASEDLGPKPPVGGEANLFSVPNPEWAWLHNRDDLAFAIWNTGLLADGKYDLRLEMFDKNGNKLKPSAAGFKFALPTAAIGIVNDSLYVESDGSLILHVHVDNRKTVADIQSIGLGGTPTLECQFLEYQNSSDAVNIQYVAYHPNDFLDSYSLAVKRGISGTTVASKSSTIPAATSTTESYTCQYLLRKVGLLGPFEQCAFAVELHTYPRTRDGHSRIRDYEDHDTSAFALTKK